MEKAYRHLVKWALDQGYRVDVDYDGSGDPDGVFEDCAFKQAIDEIHAVDNPVVVLRDKATGERLGWFSIVWGWGNAPDETIADYACTDVAEAWERVYYNNPK